MRRCATIAFATLLAACSSVESVTPPPPPPPVPGAPAVVVLVTGDGQTAVPGSVLPVRLSVQVKDAAGLAVPGVTVHFAIDSGEGTLSTLTGTTGSDGTVSGVTWTLGGGSGSNVVAVTVNALAPVRFHATATGPAARTILANTPVGAAGGTFTYTKSGDALSGLAVTVMPGAFATTTPWSIVADTSLTVPLPAGFSQVGPTLVINTGQGFADSNMTLTMPMQVSANMAVAPFYFDPASGTLEGIPLVARTATSATLATRHFSADLMAIPGSGAVGGLRASLRQGFGAVRVVWVMIPQAQLAGTFTSGFMPGTDDWEFANYGDYIGPGGDCEGMSITAMYYHYFFRLGPSPAPGLYHKYDQSILNQWDNVQGIRYAGSVQGDYLARFAAGFNQARDLITAAQAAGSLAQDLTVSSIALTLKLTGRPVLMSLYGAAGGHAVVAYAVTSSATSTTVSVADPNRPGNQSVVLSYIQGVLLPTPFQTNATTPGSNYTSSYALGVSAEVPMNQLSQRWAEFVQQRAGSDRYPANYHVQILNPVDTSWSTLTASVVSYATTARLRTVCGDCFIPNPPDGEQTIRIWNGAGNLPVYDSIVPLTATPASLNAVAIAASDFGFGKSGFVDVVPFTIVYQNVTVAGPATWDPNVPLAFVVQNPPNVPGAHYQFTWDFGDGTTPSGATDSPNMVHTYIATGVRTVTVSIVDLQTGHVIVRASTSNTVGNPVPMIQFDIRGTWPPNTAPPVGSYAFTDFVGPRQAGTPTLDALLAEYDRAPSVGGFSNGVTMFLVVPTGGVPTAGQVFTKVQSGAPQAGQFVLSLSLDLSDPANNPAASLPGSTGTLTVTAIAPLSDGSFFAEYTFSISNGTGGTVTGSGVAHWQ